MEEHSQTHEQLPAKWLRILFYAHIATIVKTFVSYLPIAGTWTVWLGWAICALCCVCLFLLAPANAGYRKAAIFLAAQLGCALLSALFIPVLTYATLPLSVICCYFELHSHAQLVENQDSNLSKIFRSLFIWNLLVSALSMAASALLTVLGFANVDITLLANIISRIMLSCGLVFDVLYLVFLHRLLRLTEN